MRAPCVPSHHFFLSCVSHGCPYRRCIHLGMNGMSMPLVFRPACHKKRPTIRSAIGGGVMPAHSTLCRWQNLHQTCQNWHKTRGPARRPSLPIPHQHLWRAPVPHTPSNFRVALCEVISRGVGSLTHTHPPIGPPSSGTITRAPAPAPTAALTPMPLPLAPTPIRACGLSCPDQTEQNSVRWCSVLKVWQCIAGQCVSEGGEQAWRPSALWAQERLASCTVATFVQNQHHFTLGQSVSLPSPCPGCRKHKAMCDATMLGRFACSHRSMRHSISVSQQTAHLD